MFDVRSRVQKIVGVTEENIYPLHLLDFTMTIAIEYRERDRVS